MTLRIKLLSFALISFLIISFLFPIKKKEVKISSSPNLAEGFVIMELFTSQGCSSCPPADNLLGKYVSGNNEQIIPLAFHVDYWNRLGWTDSFSSSKYSNRQKEYSMIIKNSSVYTPQIIINGTRELVGSEAAKIAAYVEAALDEKPLVTITLQRAERTGRSIAVKYMLDQTGANVNLHAALVQKQAVTNILKGENRGLKLTNFNVVRDFLTMPVDAKSGALVLQLPAGYDEKNFSIVLYAQEKASGRIIGGVKKDL